MSFIKGMYPTKIIEGKWWDTPRIDNLDDLRPKPKKDTLLIVGDATGVVDDIEKFLDFGVPFDTMCINYSPNIVPWDIQHFIAGDSHMPDMQAIAKTLPEGTIKHCWNPNSKGFDVRWVRNAKPGWNGTTANLGIKIGIALGYLRIVLAGVPMDNSGNWYQPLIPKEDVKQGKDHRAHLWKWNEIASRPVARLIRSMSGNTKELLGEPTEEWLNFKIRRENEKERGREITGSQEAIGQSCASC